MILDLDILTELLTARGIPFERRERDDGVVLVVRNEATGFDLDYLDGSYSSYSAHMHFTKDGKLVAVYAGC
jgi:hypothetical protein